MFSVVCIVIGCQLLLLFFCDKLMHHFDKFQTNTELHLMTQFFSYFKFDFASYFMGIKSF